MIWHNSITVDCIKMTLVERCVVSMFEGENFDKMFSALPPIIQRQLRSLVVCLKKNDLIFACGQGCLSAVRYFVEGGADIHARNDKALRSAVYYGHLDVVKFLVKKGADIHNWGDWALQWAAANGHLDIVKFLVERGVNVRAMDDEALRWAAISGHLDVVKYLNSVM